MRIKDIQINGFGNLVDKKIELNDGINLIIGNNESGKSTLANFLKCVFYGAGKTKNGMPFSEQERFKPWGTDIFSGSIDYVQNGKYYKVFREFNKNNCKVFDDVGNDISNDFNKDKSHGIEIGIEQFGIDEDVFLNTVFVSQNKNIINNNNRQTVVQKLTNMIQSGDEAVSYDKARQKLQKKLLDEVGTDRTQNKPLNTISREITVLEDKKSNLMANRTKKDNIVELDEELDKKIIEAKNEIEKVEKVIEIKSRYNNLLKEKENDHEILLKIAEKEYDKALSDAQTRRKNILIISLIIFCLAIASLMYFKMFIPAAILLGVSIFSELFILKFIGKNVKKNDVPNFDVTKEDFKKKEDKELYFLKKDGIGESLTDRKLSDLLILQDGIKKKVDDLILEKHKLKIEADNLKENLDRLNEIEERLEELYEKDEEIRKYEYILKLSIEKLDEAYSDLKKEVVPKFERLIRESISETTNGKYNDIIYNDKNGLLTQNEFGEIISIDKLSIGTIEQAYLGFRLATAKHFGDLPLILDESFSFYDDERLKNIMRLFNDKYNDRQIILLSCSEREKVLFEQLGIKYNLIKI